MSFALAFFIATFLIIFRVFGQMLCMAIMGAKKITVKVYMQLIVLFCFLSAFVCTYKGW